MRRIHHANGKRCDCDMKFSDDPAAYTEAHPNKRSEEGATFNDELRSFVESQRPVGLFHPEDE